MSNLPDKKEQRKLGLRSLHLGSWLLLVVAVLAVVGGVYYYRWYQQQQEQKKYIFSINEKKYLRSDYQAEMAKPQNSALDKTKTLDWYIEVKKREYSLEKMGVKTDPASISKFTASTSTQNYDALSIAQKIELMDRYAIAAVGTGQNGEYEGYYYTFPFSQRISPDAKGSVDGWGDQTKIDQDKAYAKDQAESYRTAVESGQTTDDAAAKAIRDNKRLWFWNVGNYSGYFGPDKTKFADSKYPAMAKFAWYKQVIPTTLVSTIKNIEKPQITTIAVGKETPATAGSAEQSYDSYYYFIHVTKVSQVGNSSVSLKNYQDTLKSVKVVKYDKV